MSSIRQLIYFIFITSLSLGCTNSSAKNESQSKSFSPPRSLQLTQYHGKFFTLTAWQRLTRPGHAIRIYIEGDGAAWKTRSQPSRDPTPSNPIALRLAAQDTSDNVIYLARPCQFLSYQKASYSEICRDNTHSTSQRFSQAILDDYLNIVEQIARANSSPQFELIGFSGGANIAGLIATYRNDVASLRTVAGNIDNTYVVQTHKVSPMPHALSMADSAHVLINIPQIHFIGAQDKIIPYAIFQHFTKNLSNNHCVSHHIISAASHTEGWEETWPSLLAITPSCRE